MKKIEGFEEVWPNSYDFILYLKDSGIPIGNITADRENSKYNSIELAYNMHPSYWRKGYTMEALVEIMKFLFNQGYDNIISGYSEGNIASKSLAEKMGFEPLETKYAAWEKNGIKINDYDTIISKEKFYELYETGAKRK